MKTNETEAREMADEGMPVETRRSYRATCCPAAGTWC